MLVVACKKANIPLGRTWPMAAPPVECCASVQLRPRACCTVQHALASRMASPCCGVTTANSPAWPPPRPVARLATSAVHARLPLNALAAREHGRASGGTRVSGACAVQCSERLGASKMWGWFGIALPSVIVCVTLIVRVRSARPLRRSASCTIWKVASAECAAVWLHRACRPRP